MLTEFDKAVIPIVVAIIAWCNQKWGLHFDTDPTIVGGIVGAVTSIIVYFWPNKAAT
jgi:hypothetical protein